YEAIIFIVFPLLGKAALGLSVGFYFAITVALYTVFSTFVSLHTGEHRFP
ncbi:MAG: CDP-alcohol phosphatidyltransferase family protein, partial [Desulfuromonas sp.]